MEERGIFKRAKPKSQAIAQAKKNATVVAGIALGHNLASSELIRSGHAIRQGLHGSGVVGFVVWIRGC